MVNLVASLTGPFPAVMASTATGWSTPAPGYTGILPLTVAVQGGATDGTTRVRCDPIPGKVRVCNANYGAGNGWLGLASLWLDGSSHITAGTVRMNDGYLTKAGGPYAYDVVRRHVMCQEVGHTFGLAHQYAVAGSTLQNGISCMNDSGNTLKLQTHTVPNGHDWEQLAQMYAHTDNSNTLARLLLRVARRAAARNANAGEEGTGTGTGAALLRGANVDAEAAVGDAEAAAERAWEGMVAELPVAAGASWERHDVAAVDAHLAAAAAAGAASPVARARFLVSDYGEGRVVVTHVMRAEVA